MSEPSEMIDWLDRRIASVSTWLKDHGRHSKRPRPEHEISAKEYDIARFEEIKGAYLRALKKRMEAA